MAPTIDPDRYQQLVGLLAKMEDEPSRRVPTEDDSFCVRSVLASKYLAVGAPETIGVLGFRDITPYLVALHREIFPTIIARTEETHQPEQCLASDVVCLSSDAPFDPSWVPDGSHVNVFHCSSPAKLPGLIAQFLHDHSVTLQSAEERGFLPNGSVHGSLADVVVGAVSGRVGEEVTVYLHLAGTRF